MEVRFNNTPVGQSCNDKVDYIYKYCYIDNQGNFVAPRAFWDELLKYCHPWEMLLVSEGDRRMATPVPVKTRKMIKLERAQKAGQAQIHWMEAQYLELRRAHDDL